MALLSAFIATIAVYALLMALGWLILSNVRSFSVVFWYMGVLAPIICMYVAFQVLRFFHYPPDRGWIVAFALTGFVALSVINFVMGYVNAEQGSALAWNFVIGLAVVHIIAFVCPVLIFGRRLLTPKGG